MVHTVRTHSWVFSAYYPWTWVCFIFLVLSSFFQILLSNRTFLDLLPYSDIPNYPFPSSFGYRFCLPYFFLLEVLQSFQSTSLSPIREYTVLAIHRLDIQWSPPSTTLKSRKRSGYGHASSIFVLIPGHYECPRMEAILCWLTSIHQGKGGGGGHHPWHRLAEMILTSWLNIRYRFTWTTILRFWCIDFFVHSIPPPTLHRARSHSDRARTVVVGAWL